MRRTAAALLAFALLAGPAPARADDAARLALARQVVEAAHAGDALRALRPTFLGQMRQMLQNADGGGDAGRVDLYLGLFAKRFDDGAPEFVDRAARVYAREFSEADLGDLLGFYRSPAGQRLIERQVAIDQGLARIGAEWGRGVARGVSAAFKGEREP